MKYHELEKKATPGPLRAMPRHWDELSDLIRSDNCSIATAFDERRAIADAALLAHCRNHFGELLAGLKSAVDGARAGGCFAAFDLDLDALIAKCEEVEGI